MKERVVTMEGVLDIAFFELSLYSLCQTKCVSSFSFQVIEGPWNLSTLSKLRV